MVSTTAVPKVVSSSINITAPVGVLVPGGTATTVAVKVTGCPCPAGFGEEARATVVFALLTAVVCVDELLVEMESVSLELTVAVLESVPPVTPVRITRKVIVAVFVGVIVPSAQVTVPFAPTAGVEQVP